MNATAVSEDDASGAKAEVVVRADHAPHIRLPEAHYCFAYHIVIRNIGRAAFQLISREWRITDGDGKTREVCGDGVIGEQPHIPPNENFAYTSYVDLPTPAGSMSGFYTMRIADGGDFAVAIPRFSLFVPRHIH